MNERLQTGLRHTVLMLALTCACAANFSCRGKASNPETGTETPSTSAEPKVVPEETMLPVFGQIPDFELVDSHGGDVDLEYLRDKLFVVNFFFTTCTATCPEQTRRIHELQQTLQSHPDWGDMRLLSITVDPGHDTPEVLRVYAEAAGADPEHWLFLTGSREAIWELSQEGFKLGVGDAPPDAEMPLFHSPRFVLVDFYGRIRGYYDGLTDEGIESLHNGIDLVLKERLPYPPDVIRPDWLEPRRRRQLETINEFDVFVDFGFEDRSRESGIRFRNRIVDDAGKSWKEAHYDHGNGIAIADVDGDDHLDLYLTTQAGPNELWRNLGNGQFEKVTSQPELALEDRISVTASFADVDNDSDADLYVTTVRYGNVLFENNGSGEFRDVTQQSGLGYAGHSSSSVFFDFDRDGLLDLFLTNVGRYTSDEIGTVMPKPVRGEDGDEEFEYYRALPDGFAGHLKPDERNERSLLFRNTGGLQFVDVTDEMGLHDVSWTGDASPVDVNDDGWPDLYVLNMQGHDEYYENREGRSFVRRSEEVFPETPWGSMGIKVFDYDNDGRFDIFITDMHSDMSEDIDPAFEKEKATMRWPATLVQTGEHNPQPGRSSIWGNALFRRLDDGTFDEVSDPMQAENYWPWGLSVGDINADGFDDVFISSSMCFPFRYGINTVLINNRGRKFLDSEFILGVEPRLDERSAAPWFELDCSHLPDQDHRLCRDRQGRFVVWSALGTKASAIFDIDNDGDLDIVTNEANEEPLVLVSNLSEAKTDLRYLKVRLVGTQSNRDGLGAIVKVTAGSDTYAKVYDGLSGYLSHGLYPLYFGLGEAEVVDAVEVHWPSGVVQRVEGPIETNQLFEIQEEE